MKKIISLFLVVFVLGLSLLPGKSTFAFTGGLLNGIPLIDSGNVGDSSTNTNTTFTDNNLNSSSNFILGHYYWHRFINDVVVTDYKLKAMTTNTYTIKFYDKNLNVLRTISPAVYNNTKTSISSVSAVSYVSIYSSKTSTVSEFDIFGSLDIKHDDLTNLLVTPSYNKVDLSWNIPSTNLNFTESKIYRDGTLISTLDKSKTTFTDSTVTSSKTYTYKIAATYSDGFITSGISQQTTTLDEPKPVADVTNLKSTLLNNKVVLTWVNPTDSKFSKVKIYRNNVFIYETTGTSFDDTSIQPNTTYQYKITTVSTDNLESTGVTTSITTPKENPPTLDGGVYQKDQNGDYEFSWSAPTTGKIKILIDGQEYKIVDASLLKILIPKEDMKYDILGNPSVTMIPISESGLEGVPTVPKPIDSDSGIQTPFTVNDLVGTGFNLFWVIAPLFLLVLAFLLVPKLRNLLFGAFRKNGQVATQTKIKDDSKRRFQTNETDIKDQQDKLQTERQEKERVERKKRQEKAYLSRLESRENRIRVAKLSKRERETRQPRATRVRNRPFRTTRAERER